MVLSFAWVGGRTGAATAAVLREVTDERVHVLEVGAIDYVAALLPAAQEPGAREVREMEGERGAGQLELVGDLAGGQVFGPRFDKQPIDLEPRFLRQRRERVDNLRHFHISRIVEMKADVKRPQKRGRSPVWLVPDLGGDLDDARKLRPLLVLGEQVAVVRAREAALRREAKVLERHELRRLVDAALQAFLRLEGARLGGDKAKHDFLSVWQEAQRPEAARALAVVLHEE